MGGIGNHNSAKVVPSQRRALKKAANGIKSGQLTRHLSF
jgi:hypothetical protein